MYSACEKKREEDGEKGSEANNIIFFTIFKLQGKQKVVIDFFSLARKDFFLLARFFIFFVLARFVKYLLSNLRLQKGHADPQLKGTAGCER